MGSIILAMYFLHQIMRIVDQIHSLQEEQVLQNLDRISSLVIIKK